MKYACAILWLATLVLFPFGYSQAATHDTDGAVQCRLSVAFDIPQSKITGHESIPTAGKNEITLQVSALSILDVTLNGKKVSFARKGDSISIYPSEAGIIGISYEGSFPAPRGSGSPGAIPDNLISDGFISLTGIWYPRPEGLLTYGLNAELPSGYLAVSEADRIESSPGQGQRSFDFIFGHALDHMTFIASDRFKVLKDRQGKVDLYAYFFEDDMGLAKQYIGHAKEFLSLYEKMIGPYPYGRFSIIENVLPTGFSMPTYTLLGQDVVRLPFIVRTSLGHEILHQWFGNSVYIDFARGNWAEGLTTYLADYYYEERQGRGAEYRKQILIDYQSYVHKNNAFPLRKFIGRVDSSSRAIGYGKSAMLFHMIRRQLGDETFFHAVKSFVRENTFRIASWEDIRSSFEKVSGADLKPFFSQWLDRKTIPILNGERASVRVSGDGFTTSFKLGQGEGPFSLVVPISVYAVGHKETLSRKFDKELTEMTLYSRELPDKIIIDEDCDVMRGLSENEFPPVVERILGEEHPVLVKAFTEKDAYKEAADAFEARGAMAAPESISDSMLGSSSFIVLGDDNPFLAKLKGMSMKEEKRGGFSVTMFKNPFNREKVIAVLNSKSARETAAALPKIFHYGKYTRLAFNNGQNIIKETEPSRRGISVEIDAETPAVHVPDIKGLSQVINNVRDKRIVYVGEDHTNYAHHAVQLEFIRELHSRGEKIAIGMEMFQRPFQKVLDEYISGGIDQGTFLRRSEYFKRWGFDYLLYKPILDYARDHRIPVIALNIEREIVDKVSQIGVDALPAEMKAKIPAEMDLSDEQYKKRLLSIFEEHVAFKQRSFDFFFQSQVLWDETMSQSIDRYLSAHPDYRMIVLAGNGHLMYFSGIPKRTFRRNGLSNAVILNDAELDKSIADYVVYPKRIEGPMPARMMVLLEENNGEVRISGFPENSIARKAGLEEGDVILSVDGIRVLSIDDLKIHLLDKKPGETISVRVSRKGLFGAKKELNFDFKL